MTPLQEAQHLVALWKQTMVSGGWYGVTDDDFERLEARLVLVYADVARLREALTSTLRQLTPIVDPSDEYLKWIEWVHGTLAATEPSKLEHPNHCLCDNCVCGHCGNRHEDCTATEPRS